MEGKKIDRQRNAQAAAAGRQGGRPKRPGLRSAESSGQLRLLERSGISGGAGVVQRAPIRVKGNRFREDDLLFDFVGENATEQLYSIQLPSGSIVFTYSPEADTYTFGEVTYGTLAELVAWLDKGKVEESDAPPENATPEAPPRPEVADRLPDRARSKKPRRRRKSSYRSLHRAGLTRPKKFALDGAERESQAALFGSLDRTFEGRGIRDANKGILSMAIRVGKDGIELHSTGKIRDAGAMRPLEEPLPEAEQQAVVRLVEKVLKKSGQWDYLRRNRKLLINQEWSVIVDVDFYYSRDRGRTRFHMDSSGETLFTNLIYNDFAQREKLGPETISDLSFLSDTDQDMLDEHFGGENQFPGRLARNIRRIRRGAPDKKGKPEIKGEKVAPLDIVTFTDPTTLHATPAPEGHKDDDYTANFLRETKQIQLPTDMQRTVPGAVSSELRAGLQIREGDDPQRRSFLRMWVQIVRTAASDIIRDILKMNEQLYVLDQFVKNDLKNTTEGYLFYEVLLAKFHLDDWLAQLHHRIISGQMGGTYEMGQKRQLIEALLATLKRLEAVVGRLSDPTVKVQMKPKFNKLRACIDLLEE
ncbi:hypothetical protein CLV84_1027 [Neolewinella xylanilytica]|uniref:Uncharacterized protein n=1 Tax=Neolewinella xylanilytica TaxID=1514080 RepID=A0A2S6I986_9BACT|nr:hypothetical protein [Neolewinella xylanilytica]PPK88064.1 hypothetical protein CLV84_1027 [Neolewinella xylanilytica]